MTKQELVTAVKKWRSTHHPKTYDENWYIQNLLGDILGWNTPEQEEISKLFMPPKPMNDEQITEEIIKVFKKHFLIPDAKDQENIDAEKRLFNPVRKDIKNLITQARKDERQRVIEKVKALLLTAQFYNPGVTRYLKLTGKEVDDLLAQLEKEEGVK